MRLIEHLACCIAMIALAGSASAALAVGNVAVSTNGEPSRIFSLNGDRRMTAVDDVWDVCTVSGRVVILDEFIPAWRARSLKVSPRK